MNNTTKKEPKESNRINVNEIHELQYWAEQFNISEEKLRQALNQVGPDVSDLKRYLQVR